jgi:4-amino-4-deoxy-L-arabinose transferase-like glycosyltransferase
VRLVVLWSKRGQELLFNDSLYYAIQATNNGTGRWFREASGPVEAWGVGPGADHPPLTSIVLAAPSRLPHHLMAMRATMTVVGVLSVLAVGLLARRVVGERAGVIAAWIAAIYPNMWLSDSLVMSESLGILLVCVCLWVALDHQRLFTIRSAALVGLAVGVAAHARSELLLFAVFALIGWRGQRRLWAVRAAVMLATTAAVVTPWVAYNTARFDRLVTMSTNDGNTLLGANCPLTYQGFELGGWDLDCLVEAVPPPADDDGAAMSDRRRAVALDFISEHRSRLPIVVAARVGRMLDLYGWPSLVQADVLEERNRIAVWLGMVAWWLLAPMAVAAWWQRRQQLSRVLLVPLVTAFVVAVVFYGSHRLRAPAEPAVVILAATWLASVRSRTDVRVQP